jgi:hypothetical protein
MAARGTFYNPTIGLVLQHYIQNRDRFLGNGNFDEEAFVRMEQAIPLALDTFKRALKTPGLRIVFGSDVNAGAHGRGVEEAIVRVRDGGQEPMEAAKWPCGGPESGPTAGRCGCRRSRPWLMSIR